MAGSERIGSVSIEVSFITKGLKKLDRSLRRIGKMQDRGDLIKKNREERLQKLKGKGEKKETKHIGKMRKIHKKIGVTMRDMNKKNEKSLNRQLSLHKKILGITLKTSKKIGQFSLKGLGKVGKWGSMAGAGGVLVQLYKRLSAPINYASDLVERAPMAHGKHVEAREKMRSVFTHKDAKIQKYYDEAIPLIFKRLEGVQAGRGTGMTDVQLTRVIGNLGTMLSPLGFEGPRLMETIQTFILSMSDVTSNRDMASLEKAIELLTKAQIGETEAMKDGTGVSAAMVPILNELLVNEKLREKTFGVLNKARDKEGNLIYKTPVTKFNQVRDEHKFGVLSTARVHFLLDALLVKGKAAGDYAATFNTFANLQRRSDNLNEQYEVRVGELLKKTTSEELAETIKKQEELIKEIGIEGKTPQEIKKLTKEYQGLALMFQQKQRAFRVQMEALPESSALSGAVTGAIDQVANQVILQLAEVVKIFKPQLQKFMDYLNDQVKKGKKPSWGETFLDDYFPWLKVFS